MGSYVDVFGVERFIGLGEGVDKLNATSAEGMAGSLHEIVCPLSLTGPDYNKDANNDGTMDSFGRGVACVPAGAAIVSVDVKIEKTPELSALVVGLYEKDGTVIDADGLYKSADGLTVGVHAGSGALIGTVMEKAGFIKADKTVLYSDTDDLEGEIVVRYIA